MSPQKKGQEEGRFSSNSETAIPCRSKSARMDAFLVKWGHSSSERQATLTREGCVRDRCRGTTAIVSLPGEGHACGRPPAGNSRDLDEACRSVSLVWSVRNAYRFPFYFPPLWADTRVTRSRDRTAA